MALLRGVKITTKDGKRKKVPTFLPLGRHGKYSKTDYAAAERKQQQWLKENQTQKGKVIAESMRKYHKLKDISNCDIPDDNTDLTFLTKMYQRQSMWNYHKARKVIELLKAGKPISAVANWVNVKVVSIKALMIELRKAARNGYTLERYFKEDRPLRYGKKVVTK